MWRTSVAMAWWLSMVIIQWSCWRCRCKIGWYRHFWLENGQCNFKIEHMDGFPYWRPSNGIRMSAPKSNHHQSFHLLLVKISTQSRVSSLKKFPVPYSSQTHSNIIMSSSFALGLMGFLPQAILQSHNPKTIYIWFFADPPWDNTFRGHITHGPCQNRGLRSFFMVHKSSWAKISKLCNEIWIQHDIAWLYVPL